MARSGPPAPATPLADPDVRVAAVVAGFPRDIAERLLAGAQARLTEAGLEHGHLDVRWVPGAFELPLAAKAGRDEEVHTMPPFRPQNALMSAEEFM